MATTSNKFKNNYGRGKRRKNRKVTNMDRKIARVAARVYEKKEAQEVEMKHYDVAEAYASSIDSAGTIINLTQDIPQGTDYNERVGNKISVKGINIRLMVFSPSATPNYNTLRIIVFRQRDQGTPSVSSILDLTTATQIRHLSQLSSSFKGSFHILYDNTYQVSFKAGSDLPFIHTDKFYISRVGNAEWTTSAGNAGGQVYMLAISDSAIIDAPDLSYTARIRYTDA